jgi:hypothetical protein
MDSGLGGVEHRNWDASSGVVCLAPSPCIAESYAEIAPDMGLVPEKVERSGIIVIEVDVTGLTLQKDPNIDHEDDPCLIYDGVIAPSRLRYYSRTSWVQDDPCAIAEGGW